MNPTQMNEHRQARVEILTLMSRAGLFRASMMRTRKDRQLLAACRREGLVTSYGTQMRMNQTGYDELHRLTS